MALAIRTLARTRHHEAVDWAKRVIDNGGTFSATTFQAVERFCRDISTAGIRDRFCRLNLLCGNGLSSVLVPLFVSQSFGGTQLGDATDTNVNFVSGDYAETGASGGLKANGTSKHLLTGLLGSEIAQDDSHLSVYGEDFNSGGTFGFPVGVRSSSVTNRIELLTRSNGTLVNIFVSQGASPQSSAIGSPAINQGHLLGTSTANNASRVYSDGTQSGVTTTTRNIATTQASQFAVFGLSTAGTVGSRVASRLSAYSIGRGMDATQVSDFYVALDRFQAALGRDK